MTIRQKQEGEVASDELVETTESEVAEKDSKELKPEEIRKLRGDLARLSRTVQGFQTENATLKKFKEDAEKEKLSVTEKAQAETAQEKRERENLAQELAAAKTELAQERLVNKLISKGLDDPEFGAIVLKQFDQDAEDFDEFTTRMKESPRFGRFFKPEDKNQNSNEAKRPAAPTAPNSGTGRQVRAAGEFSAGDKERAEARYPNNEAMQKSYLANLAKARKSIKEQAS